MAIKSVLNKKPFTYEELNKYLGNIIKWDFPKSSLESLMEYYRLAEKLNLINQVPEPKFAEII